MYPIVIKHLLTKKTAAGYSLPLERYSLSLPYKTIIVAFLLVLLSPSLLAQKQNSKRKQLEEERKSLLLKIAETKKVIAENKEKENTKMLQLKAIAAQIKTREKVINTIGQEIFEIGLEVEESKITIDTLKAQIARLRKDYANNIVAIYKNKNNLNQLSFLFNADGFNNAYKRMKYINKLSEYKQMQARSIINTQKAIEQEVNNMQKIKNENVKLYGIEQGEKKELETDKKEETQVLTVLQGKQKQLQTELKDTEKNYNRLSQKIADLIQKEIEEARRKEEERRRIAQEKERAKQIADSKKNGTPLPVERKIIPKTELSPEDMRASNDFIEMRNRLPWPVNNGFISESFGTHQHPTLKEVKTNNNGINIACKKQTEVRCVFKGKVKAIMPIPGMETFVLVKHGEYFTVYAKLVNVQVKIGQELNMGDIIATVYTAEAEQKTELHFEIFKGKQAQNPEVWLRN